MTRLTLPLTLLLPILAACELKGVSLTGDGPDEETTSSSTGGPGGGSETQAPTSTGGETSDGDTTGEPAAPVTAIDILFVIDNSGSMAGHQSRLADSMLGLLAGLEDRDLRIAVTTTDNGNPRCGAQTTTPEGGAFVMRNCLDAVEAGEFSFDQQDFSAGCTDHCFGKSANDQMIVQATPTALDPEPKLRSWIERTDGAHNAFNDLDDALACALPQGVAGCGLESPLESMYLALARAFDPTSETNYGFLRPEADLRIIFVTDESDCSYNPEFDEIFTTDTTFWEDPSLPYATSAVCFNAGVRCVGDPDAYDSCVSVDQDISGDLTMDPDQALLYPLSKYVQFLQQIQAEKVGGATVQIVALAGVPQGFETGTVPLVYADDPDAEQQDQFGIGPGCAAPDPTQPGTVITARPPTRLLGLAEALGAPQFFSICDDSFDNAMKAVGSF